MIDESSVESSVYENTNGFPMCDGKNLHMDIKKGEIANRIITVGALSRAEKIVSFFDSSSQIFSHSSGRGFSVFTGYFNEVHVSVVSIGMGPSMMDFFVRYNLKSYMSSLLFGAHISTCLIYWCIFRLGRQEQSSMDLWL